MRLSRDDRGVTLIEILVAVTLLAIIIAPLTNAMIAYLRNTNATNDRMAASHDAQIAAAYFAQDVQSIGVRDWTASPYTLQPSSVQQPAPAATCGGTAVPAGLIRMQWDAPATASGAPPVVWVSYVDDGHRQLHRMYCEGGVLKDTVLVHNLDSAPTLTSSGSPVPDSISMEVSIRVQGSTGGVLTVKLFGQRRQTS